MRLETQYNLEFQTFKCLLYSVFHRQLKQWQGQLSCLLNLYDNYGKKVTHALNSNMITS